MSVYSHSGITEQWGINEDKSVSYMYVNAFEAQT